MKSLRIVICINYNKSATCFIIYRAKPAFYEIKNLASNIVTVTLKTRCNT